MHTVPWRKQPGLDANVVVERKLRQQLGIKGQQLCLLLDAAQGLLQVLPVRRMQFHATRVTLVLPPSGCSSEIAPGAACVLNAISCHKSNVNSASFWMQLRDCSRCCLRTECMFRVGQNRIYTVYTRNFWQGNHQVYGARMRFWPTLHV